MANEIDYDNMTDDQIDDILSQIDSGTFGSDDENQDGANTNLDENNENHSEDGDENLNNRNLEDTEGDNDEDENSDTNQLNDGLTNDTENKSSEGDSENSQVEQSNGNVEGNADTSNPEDAKGAETGKIDPAEYERLKKFYDEIANAEFIANGKKVKGFTDPSKIIRSQQMLHDYSNKMRGINEYKPYLKALKEKGIIGDEEKFNFAMSLLDGDKATIKKHMEALKIDLVDLELDEDSKYVPKNYIPSKQSMVLDEAMEIASNIGVDSKLRSVIAKDWDDDSFAEFLNNPSVRNDLLTHMQDGTYDIVQNKINELEMLDMNGSYRGLKSTDKYRTAIAEINRENQSRPVNPSAYQNQYANQQQNNGSYIDAERARLVDLAAKEAEYKAMAEKKLRDDEARKKAAMITKKKTTTVTQKKFDPLELEGDALDEFVNELISSSKK